jgi:hypothetical protein
MRELLFDFVTSHQGSPIHPTIDESKSCVKWETNENRITYVVVDLRCVESHVQAVTPDLVEFRI